MESNPTPMADRGGALLRADRPIRLITIATVLALAASLLFAATTQERAEASGWAYVQVRIGDWHCPSGKVVATNVALVPGNGTRVYQAGPYSGWLKAPLSRRVTVAAVVYCKSSWWRPAYPVEVTTTRWFTRNWQTKWV